jgi:hypothetical protein
MSPIIAQQSHFDEMNMNLRHVYHEALHVRLLAPQSAQQSPERCLHLDVLLFNVLDAEDAPVHHVLVIVQQRVGLH